MKKTLIWLITIVFVISMAITGAGCKTEAAPAEEEVMEEEVAEEEVMEEEGAEEEVAEEEMPAEELHFIFVSPGTSYQFWLDVADGIMAAASELGVTVDVVGPPEVDILAQVEVIEAAIADKPDGILTMCITPDAYLDVIDKAVDAGIPVVLMDGDCPDSKRSFLTYSDTFGQGEQVFKKVAEAKDGKAKIGIITAGLDIEIINWRLDGVNSVVDQYPDMEIIDIQDAQGDVLLAQEKAIAMMQTYPEIDVMVAAGASDVPGVGNAISELKMGDTVMGVAFNDDPQGIDYLKEGIYDYIMAVIPFHYGHVPLQALYQVVTGQITDLSDTVDVYSVFITKDNADTYKDTPPPSLDDLIADQF